MNKHIYLYKYITIKYGWFCGKSIFLVYNEWRRYYDDAWRGRNIVMAIFFFSQNVYLTLQYSQLFAWIYTFNSKQTHWNKLYCWCEISGIFLRVSLVYLYFTVLSCYCCCKCSKETWIVNWVLGLKWDCFDCGKQG